MMSVLLGVSDSMIGGRLRVIKVQNPPAGFAGGLDGGSWNRGSDHTLALAHIHMQRQLAGVERNFIGKTLDQGK
jgi:hypothetical protein